MKDNIDKYLEPEYPQLTNDESSYGFNYSYIGPDKAADGPDPLFTYCPRIGDLWDETASGRAINKPEGLLLRVRSVSYTPRIGNSKYSRLEISTVQQITTDAGTIGNKDSELIKDEVEWQFVWQRQVCPLIRHPALLPVSAFKETPPSGTHFPLDATAGSPSRTGYEDVLGWEAMPECAAKLANQYYPINVDGSQSSSLRTVVVPGALAYVKMRKLGAEYYDEYIPVLTKTSLYRGKNPPPIEKEASTGNGSPIPTNLVGRYIKTGNSLKPPQADFCPDGYRWVKTGDSFRKQGKTLYWNRTEEWTGALYILYDNRELNPSGITID
jgi:hypothetical protein